MKGQLGVTIQVVLPSHYLVISERYQPPPKHL